MGLKRSHLRPDIVRASEVARGRAVKRISRGGRESALVN